MSKIIKISNNREVIVDDEYYDDLMKWNWSFSKRYAVRRKRYGPRKENKGRWIYMHREVLNLKDNRFPEVDHINGDGLDNRKCNLRTGTHELNCRNKRNLSKSSPTGYRGVYFQGNKYFAQISIKNKSLRLGTFSDKIEAAKAYDNKVKELYGDFAVLNFPEEKNK